ncbi:MAG TPA: cytochrome c oxidase subunit 3 [Gaiellaceae bacterium]|nr:cytochrome c oxidase subunit 3 [Gaiellaceae bacterium]
MTAAALPRRPSIPAAWWGMGILIASESVLFGCMISTYFYFRFRSPVWPQGGVSPPELVAPIVTAACLATTSVPMQLAAFAARAGRLAATRLYVVAALVVQCGYLAYELRDYNNQLDKTDITRNAYTSIYYTLLGADHGHVLLGVLFNIWLLWKLSRGLNRYRSNATLAIAWYWHFANAATLAVVGTILSARV